jgi:uncharacterized protein YjcR
VLHGKRRQKEEGTS